MAASPFLTAEQLLYDSPAGVDVFGLKVWREIKLMAENGWPAAILTLDANNQNISDNNIMSGNHEALSPGAAKRPCTRVSEPRGSTKSIRNGMPAGSS